MSETAPIMPFRFVRPDVPPVSAWAAFLDEAYRIGIFSNFGPLSRRLEAQLALRWGNTGIACILASSGTAALAAPLIARSVTGPVLLPAFTFPATLSAVRMAGAEPVVMDVGQDGCVTVDDMDSALAETGAKAAIVVAPFGLARDFSDHAAVARDHDALLIIDNAAGLGGRRLGVPQPHVYEAFSLHATKPFSVGEGGAIFCAPDAAEGLRGALNFALPTLLSPDGPHWGLNGKLSELHAAIGLAVAEIYDDLLARRRAMAARYIDLMTAFPDIAGPKDAGDGPWQCFPLRLPSPAAAEAFTARCQTDGLEVRRYYRPSLSVIPDVTRLGDCPVSEDLAGRMCCLPVYARESKGEMAAIRDIVGRALRSALNR